MNIQENVIQFNKDDFALDFEVTSAGMELQGEMETLSTIKTLITKVTCKSTCTCVCTSFCTIGCG